MKKSFLVTMLLLTATCFAQASTCTKDQYKGDNGKCYDWPKVASVELVHEAGTVVNYVLPQGSQINVSWHVFLQAPSGTVDSVEGLSWCAKGSSQNCEEALITFTIPRDYKEGHYRLLGAKFFAETVLLNDTLSVVPYSNSGVDKDDAAFVHQLITK